MGKAFVSTPSGESRIKLAVAIAAFAVVAVPASGLFAGSIFDKADNTTPLNQAASYVGPPAAPPTIADTIRWNNPDAVSTTVDTGGAIIVVGLTFDRWASPYTITSTGAAGITLKTNGTDTAFLDMSNPLGPNVIFRASGGRGLIADSGSPQTWTIASGRTLTLTLPVGATSGGYDQNFRSVTTWTGGGTIGFDVSTSSGGGRYIGTDQAAGVIGTINIGSSTVAANSGITLNVSNNARVGENAGVINEYENSAVNITSAATSGSAMIIADLASTSATYNLFGGQVNVTNTGSGTTSILLGNKSAATGTMNVTGGTISSTGNVSLRLGSFAGGTGVYVQDGGVTSVSSVNIGHAAGATGTFSVGVGVAGSPNLTPGGTFNVTTMNVGATGAGTATLAGSGIINLKGTATIGGASSTGSLALNGGSLNFTNALATLVTTASGTVTAAGGTITNASGATVTIGVPITLNAGGLTVGASSVNTGRDLTLNGVLSGGGGVTVNIGGSNAAIVNGANTYAGSSIVQSGTLVVAPAAREPVLGGATVTSPGGADLQGGKLVFTYVDAGSSPAAQVASILDAGYDQSPTFSSGLIRATTLANNRVLGWIDSANTVTVAATLPADSNLDFSVNFDDLVTLAQNYNGTGKVWAEGDTNYDQVVDFTDLVALVQNYNTTALTAGEANVYGSSFAADYALALSMVPEPTTLCLLTGVATTLLGRRRR